jgi:hypothetical protein
MYWEKTILANDLMAAGPITSSSAFTIFDVALLMDTNWYTVQYSGSLS